MLAAFGGVEEDQHYTRLVDSFADDAVYYDPLEDGESGLSARAIGRRLSSVSGLFEYLVAIEAVSKRA